VVFKPADCREIRLLKGINWNDCNVVGVRGGSKINRWETQHHAAVRNQVEGKDGAWEAVIYEKQHNTGATIGVSTIGKRQQTAKIDNKSRSQGERLAPQREEPMPSKDLTGGGKRGQIKGSGVEECANLGRQKGKERRDALRLRRRCKKFGEELTRRNAVPLKKIQERRMLYWKGDKGHL